MGVFYPLGSAQVLPQAPIGFSSLSTASPLLSVPHPAVPSSSFPAFQPQGVSGFYPPDFSLAFVFLDVACLFCSWLGLSSAGFSGSLFPCGALPGAPLLSAAFVCSAPIGSSAGLFGFLSASAGSFIDFVGASPQPGSAPAYAPLSGTSTAPSLLLSQCLVRVLLSLWSGFVAQVATGAVAPVPEAFGPHICLLPLMLVSDLMVAILTLAASSSQAPLPTCSFSWSSS